MRKLWRKIGRIFIMMWSTNIYYRGDVFIWTLTETITPLIALAIWFTLATQGNTATSPRDTLTYYILAMLVMTATASWVSYFLTQAILDGQIIKYLTRPFSAFWEQITDNIIVKSLRLAIPIPVVIIIFIFFPEWFSPSIYESVRIVLAILSIALGAVIAFVVDSILATLAFWLEDVHQIIGYHYLLWTIGTGVLIPYIFLPQTIKIILSFLPYRYIVSAPIEILVSSSSNTPATTLIMIQIAWIIGLTVVLKVLWKRGLRRYAIPGQ